MNSAAVLSLLCGCTFTMLATVLPRLGAVGHAAVQRIEAVAMSLPERHATPQQRRGMGVPVSGASSLGLRGPFASACGPLQPGSAGGGRCAMRRCPARPPRPSPRPSSACATAAPCSSAWLFQSVGPRLAAELGLDAATLADLGASFFWAYLVRMTPCGILAVMPSRPLPASRGPGAGRGRRPRRGGATG